MIIYKKHDIIVIPFPFVDRDDSKTRPAIVISDEKFNKSHEHTICSMVTTASNSKWDSDIEISNLEISGLPKKSFIRMKLFTIDNRLIKKSIGKLDKKDSEKLIKTLKKII